MIKKTFTPEIGQAPQYRIALDIPGELKSLIILAIEEAGEMGITTDGIRRRTQGGRFFGQLVSSAIQEMVEEGALEVEKVQPEGGRGRPRQVVRKGNGDCGH